MAKSFAKVRCGAAALLCAASLAGACGGGGGGGGDDGDSAKDAGSTDNPKDASRDAKTNIPDGGPITTVPDASSDDLQAALKQDGTDTSMTRAMLVFQAACARAKECEDDMYTSSCVSDYVTQYTTGQSQNYSDDCLDATLDFGACSATVATCDDYFGDGCDDQYHRQETACAPYLADAGAP